MARNERTAAGPFWTRNWIEKMWRFTAENFVDFDTGSVDFEALGREEYEFRKALFYRKFKNSQRAKEAFEESNALYMVNVERGKKGGRPRKDATTPDDKHDDQAPPSRGGSAATISGTPEALVNQRRAGADSVRGTPSHRAPARPQAPFRNKEDFIQWAIDDGLDPVDANECWEATEERGGKDADGNTVKNMKAFARQWCRTRKDNRRTA